LIPDEFIMKMSFRTRILLAVSLSSVLCTLVAAGIARHRLQETGEEALASKSRAILSRLEVGRDYVASQGTLDAVIEESKRRFPDGRLSDEQKLKVLRSVPVFAALELGRIGSEAENYQFRVASDAPRHAKNQATEDAL
jgi:hypothetical protein